MMVRNLCLIGGCHPTDSVDIHGLGPLRVQPPAEAWYVSTVIHAPA